ncbi:MAG: ATP-binding protein [Propionibacteriaceae bacterium]|jgi:predicted AAA+ superfamily ATPase|nr:ATP-binding protein [Propionibacteriaceae bacterium]
MGEEPVILLEGPRTVGKSTLMRQIADQTGGTIVDLDDLPTRSVALADPTLVVDQRPPVLIDEYKHAPDVLSAVKARLNRTGSVPGQFVLTGSSTYDTLPRTAEALTGRMHRMQVLPLAQSELRRTSDRGRVGLLADLFAVGADVVSATPSTTTRQQYVELMVAGGFPDALVRSSAASRGRWFDDYIHATLAKDVADLKKLRQAQALPAVLQSLAGQTGQVLNVSRVAQELRLTSELVVNYTHLLEAVYLLRVLPAWGKTLSIRSSGRPKLHVVDTGVAARLLRLSVEKLASADPTSLTEFGHLAETFVVGEILKEIAWMDGIAGVGHWRTYDDDEVDLVIERDDGAIVAMKIKASTHAAKGAFTALAKLRDKVGPAFRVGVAFHLGTRAHHYSDRLIALPVDRLWTSAEAAH